MVKLNDKRSIPLPKGGTLEMEMSQEFLYKLSHHMALPLDQITDDHIRMFVWGSLNTAIDRAEAGMQDGRAEEAT